MPFDDQDAQKLKFKSALTAFYLRWAEESDLDSLEMAEASTEVINVMCNDSVIDFEPDDELIDRAFEEEGDE